MLHLIARKVNNDENSVLTFSRVHIYRKSRLFVPRSLGACSEVAKRETTKTLAF